MKSSSKTNLDTKKPISKSELYNAIAKNWSATLGSVTSFELIIYLSLYNLVKRFFINRMQLISCDWTKCTVLNFENIALVLLKSISYFSVVLYRTAVEVCIANNHELFNLIFYLTDAIA